METHENCLFCAGGHLHEDVRIETYSYKGHSIEISQPGMYCDSCDEAVLNESHLKATRKEIHDLHAVGDCFLTSDEVKSIRKKLSLTQQKAGDFFGGGANAFSRYERGETMQSRSTDKLLRLLDKNPELFKVDSDDCNEKVGRKSFTDWAVFPRGNANVCVKVNVMSSGEFISHNDFGVDSCSVKSFEMTQPELLELPMAA